MAYADKNRQHLELTDRLFIPTDYPLVTRVIWFDDNGKTLAKWNPYTFFSPPSSLKEYDFFLQLQKKNADDASLVFSAGKSNITGEFQLSLSRRLKIPIDTFSSGGRPKPAKSFGVIMTFYLRSGLRPVLPRGYGFCLVDSAMNVLMHSDPRRNLAENFYKETAENDRVKNCINLKTAEWIDGVNLYGAKNSLYVRPVIGQDISLIVFYNDDTHAENIFRMMHFGMETQMYVAIAFLFCVLLSIRPRRSPRRLRFDIDPLEWIRPLRRNWKVYQFVTRYLICLFIWAVAYFVISWWFILDIRIELFISVLLPFYALWGVVMARGKIVSCFMAESNTGKGWMPSTWPVVGMLALFNWFLYRVMTNEKVNCDGSVLYHMIVFQGVAILGLFGWKNYCFPRSSKRRWREQLQKNGSRQQLPKEMGAIPGIAARAYSRGLYFSILTMSILPALGFLWYGWVVEKEQFSRADALLLAEKYISRTKYISHDLPELKKVVAEGIEGMMHCPRGISDSSGLYLTNEAIRPLPGGLRWSRDRPVSRDVSEPYITFLNQLYLITSGEYNSYAIPRRADDSSWVFSPHEPDSLCLMRLIKPDTGIPIGATTDTLFHDFGIRTLTRRGLFSFDRIGLFHWSLLVIVAAAFLLGVPFLLNMTVNRIFLLRFFKKDKDPDTILQDYFSPSELPIRDFERNKDFERCPLDEQEEFVLKTLLKRQKGFQALWEDLSKAERYFLYDFARDGYTNYKDTMTFLMLKRKGLIEYRDDRWDIFTPSFREFILQKKGSVEIGELKRECAVPGVWSTIRMPSLIIIMACAVLLFMTQDAVSHRITIAITSIGAIVPIVVEVTKRIGGKG